jgi:tetratricopeptide (TPR) repeat protein
MTIRSPGLRSLILLRKQSRRFAAVSLIMAALISVNSHAVDRIDSAYQFLQLTSFDSMLRTDAEQAGFITDRLPEDLPQELRSDLRRVMDSNLDYNKMEEALIKAALSKMDRVTIDLNSRWWATSSGREIAKAESSAYASLFSGSTFETYNPTAQPADPSNAGLVDEVLKTGKYEQFVADLLLGTADSRLCFLKTLDPAEQSDCAKMRSSVSVNADQLTSRISQIAAASYSKVSAGDLQAYLTYLRSPGALAVLTSIRDAELQIEQQSWQKVLQQTNIAMSDYAKAHFSGVNDAKLKDLVSNIDDGRNLSQARFTLLWMSRGGPPNPAILVQLARVTLKLAPDRTSNDIEPSVPRIEPAGLETARRYVDQAIALDPKRADAVMIRGHISYLQWRFQESIQSLEKAVAMGGKSPWLHVNLGDALWAQAMQPPAVNRAMSQRAAEEFELALASPLPDTAERRAVHQLGPVYAQLGDIPKSDLYERRYISMQEGRNKAYALHRYAHFLLFYAKDTDSALTAARQAVEQFNFSVGREFLVQMLAIKGGDLVAAGRPNDAVPYLNEARQLNPDLEALCPELARLPGLFPGVLGIHSVGGVKDFSGRIGGQTLIYATLYATSKQIEELISWGANPNYFDPSEGTPLHAAILADNVAAVNTLLAHGANPMTPFTDGRLPSDLSTDPSDTKRAEILADVRKAAAGRGSAMTLSGAPFRVGYEYVLKRPLDGMVNGASWADSFDVGEHLIYIGECRYSDPTVACFHVKKSADQSGRLHELAISKNELASWVNWFKEIGPEPGS